MALGVLNDTQMAAVAFVIEKSKKASERLYPSLKDRVTRLGYTEKDLDRYFYKKKHFKTRFSNFPPKIDIHTQRVGSLWNIFAFQFLIYSTLQWVRREAPIIIHVRLDFVLKFLVKDTHYRSRFETGTSGGSTDLRARSSWEVFSTLYIL